MMKTENLYTPNCIRTVSGQYVNVFDPDPDTLLIEDIAHALSNQHRFGGHLPDGRSMSIAQHLIMCCDEALEKFKFDALMHDAAEAYILDFPKPIKDGIPDYAKLENNLMVVLSEKFGFNWPMDAEIKRIDKWQLEVEWYDLMLNTPIQQPRIIPMSPQYARAKFLEYYNEWSV